MLNIFIGTILIVVWSRFVDINEIILKLKSANLFYVLLIILMIAISGAIRAIRFQKILNIPEIKVKELVFLKCANKVAAAETIAVGYLTIVYLGCRPLCVTATLLAAGMFGYSAYHIYDSSKKIKEMENKPER